MNLKDYEVRHYSFDMNTQETDGHQGQITGRPVVYNSRTDIGPFDEIIEKGALEGTNLKDVRFLVNHNFDMIPLARSRNNTENSTMQMTVDEDGMGIRVNLDIENNAEARSLYSAISRGDITGMSFCFKVGDSTWEGLDTEHPFRKIRKISDIYEVSAVSFPAYEDTSIGVRSNDKDALDSARRALESARIDEANKKTAPPDGEANRRALELEKLKAQALYF